MKRFILIIFLACRFLSGSSQQAINSSWIIGRINESDFLASVGEMTLTQVFVSHNLMITQGFLQPTIIKSTTPILNDLKHVDIDVFPNPSIHHIVIQYDGDQNKLMEAILTNIYGQQVMKLAIPQNRTILNVSGLMAGHYQLTIYSAQSLLKSFLIQKI